MLTKFTKLWKFMKLTRLIKLLPKGYINSKQWQSRSRLPGRTDYKVVRRALWKQLLIIPTSAGALHSFMLLLVTPINSLTHQQDSVGILFLVSLGVLPIVNRYVCLTGKCHITTFL